MEARFPCRTRILLCPTRKLRCRTIVAPSVRRQHLNSTRSTQAAGASPIPSRRNLQPKAPRTHMVVSSHLRRNHVRCLTTMARVFNTCLSNSRRSVRLKGTLTNSAIRHPARTRNFRPLHNRRSHNTHLRRHRTNSRHLRSLRISNKPLRQAHIRSSSSIWVPPHRRTPHTKARSAADCQ